MISLYIHIPFCKKKCDYCDFLSFPYKDNEMDSYLKALNQEIVLYGQLYKQEVKSIFIGGGTPSLLSGEQMKDLMTTIKENFLLSDCEISMESNPGTLSLDKLNAYKAAGINRISMGVQSLEDDMLKTLGRIHSADTVRDSVKKIKSAGFNNFNFDLMFGLPGQTLKQLEYTVNEMIKLNPTHISAYSLKYEEGTVFYDKLEKDELSPISDELDRDMYHKIIEKLESAGYLQYEISNFSKPGLECVHNLVYWQKEDYLGIGLGAHGCIDNERVYNTSDMATYISRVDDQKLPREGADPINREDDIFEYIILNLRLNQGLSLSSFKECYDYDFLIKEKNTIRELIEEGLMILKGDRLSLSTRGRDLSNQVFIKFLE